MFRSVRNILWTASWPARYAIRQGLSRRGLGIRPLGSPYLDAQVTVHAAQAQGRTLHDYLDSLGTDASKRGSRDRTIEAMRGCGLLQGARDVLEIGPGTGMYLERVIELGEVRSYQGYETDAGWRRHLRRTCSRRFSDLVFDWPLADGETLGQTRACSIDLVHAHAVFVYIPVLHTLSYLRDSARVLRPGGHLVADFFLAEGFDIEVIETWLNNPWKFCAPIPRPLLVGWVEHHGMHIIDEFTERRGSSYSTYLVLQRAPRI